MKKIVATLTIAYIIGILIGLYETIGIILFFIIFIFLLSIFLAVRNLVTANKYRGLIFFICVILGFFSIKMFNYKWNDISNNIDTDNVIAEVVNLEKETKYQKTFKIKILNKKIEKNKYVLLKINTNDKINKEIKIGSIIYFSGKLQEVEGSRNFGGFSYQEYLKSKNIYGIIKWKNGEIEYDKNNINDKQNIDDKENVNDRNIIKYIYNTNSKNSVNGKNNVNNKNNAKLSISNIKNLIIEKAYSNMNEDDANFFLTLSIGYKTGLSKEIKDSFSKNNLSHMLAISGMHISYMLAMINLVLKPFKSKTKSIITIILLVFFMQITGNVASVNRACIIVILNLIAPMVFRKSDQITNLAISALFILIQNPYSIKDVSFIFSYVATIGIIYIYPIIKRKIEIFTINKISMKELRVNEDSNLFIVILFKIVYFAKETIIISIAVNIVLIPIIIYNFNSLSTVFILSNLIITPMFIICVILSLGLLITNFIHVKLSILICKIFSLAVNIILLINNFFSSVSIFNLILATPSIVSLICFYMILALWIYLENNIWVAQNIFKFIKNIINIKKIVIVVIIFILLFAINTFQENNLRIYFIDVGQGDCTLIVTPHNKKILIDGGGNEGSDYDVGESVLQPYLLDRKIKVIDYIIISHFDSDHVKGLLYIMKNLKVKNAIISKQPEDSKNFDEFKEIVENKKINIIEVHKGDKINIENNLFFYVLWPDNTNFIRENSLNNNSIVCKLYYKNISMLFTGDIEQEAEKAILKMYKNNTKLLKSNVLKVAHHGSKTSSTEEFIKSVSPDIALIGVGKNNKFGHPNDGILQRLINLRCKNL